ncbi:hypothetical protein AKO1_004575 [Acrasis kona]|uniref:Uncharacterized protein n=1 Tax=Acrasis kona TaxID=1008807 RepID=A0AAW2Z556_9EUKA
MEMLIAIIQSKQGAAYFYNGFNMRTCLIKVSNVGLLSNDLAYTSRHAILYLYGHNVRTLMDQLLSLPNKEQSHIRAIMTQYCEGFDERFAEHVKNVRRSSGGGKSAQELLTTSVSIAKSSNQVQDTCASVMRDVRNYIDKENHDGLLMGLSKLKQLSACLDADDDVWDEYFPIIQSLSAELLDHQDHRIRIESLKLIDSLLVNHSQRLLLTPGSYSGMFKKTIQKFKDPTLSVQRCVDQCIRSYALVDGVRAVENLKPYIAVNYLLVNDARSHVNIVIGAFKLLCLLLRIVRRNEINTLNRDTIRFQVMSLVPPIREYLSSEQQDIRILALVCAAELTMVMSEEQSKCFMDTLSMKESGAVRHYQERLLRGEELANV